jgi:hypothetical protein
MPSAEFFVDLARRLGEAKHGEKGMLINDATRACGTRQAVYVGLHKFAGWSSGRKTRADTGKSVIAADQALYLAGYIHTKNRQTGKQIVTIEQAVEDLRVNGKLDGEFSVSTARRALERAGIAPRQMRTPAPVQPLRSLHPNHVHQIDPSVCVMYYLGNNSRFEWMTEGEFYKNKPENQDKARAGMLWRYALTDHTSSYLEPFYIKAPGESYINYFDALMYFWGRKDHTPFHGVPRYLMSDRIGAMRTHEIQSLLAALEVQHIVAQGARAKGQVENANNIIETHFEYRLRGQNVESVEHLNQLAAAWAANYNGTKRHARTGMPRTTCWLKHIREEHIRLLPSLEICRLLAEPRSQHRTVTPDMAITFSWPGTGPESYRLRHIAGLNVKDKVRVQPAPFQEGRALWVTVTAADGAETRHLVQPIQRDQFGFDKEAALIGDEHHRVAPDTPREQARKAMQKLAYNVETLAEAEAAKKSNMATFPGVDTMKSVNDSPKVHHLPRRGVEIKREIELPRNGPVQSLTLLRNRLGRPLTLAEGDELRERYPAGCTDSEIDEVAAQMRAAGVKLSEIGGRR